MIYKKVSLFIVVVFVLGCSFTWLRFGEKNHMSLSQDAVLQKWSHAIPNASRLQTGDLIFRHGRGVISSALMSFGQRERKYSHAGIISIEKNEVYVYHSIGGEENKSNILRKDLLKAFCNPNDVHSFGIYRRELSEKQKTEVDSLVRYYYYSKLEFDTDFDLKTDDKMYCTEFVYKIFNQVLPNDNHLTSSTFAKMKYIACDDLYLNPNCKLIYSWQY